MKGKRHSSDTKAKALSLYAACGNASETARELGLNARTVRLWVSETALTRASSPEADQTPLSEEEMRTRRIIEKSLLLLERRVTTALELERGIAAALEAICAEESLAASEKKSLIAKLSELELIKPSSITSIVAALSEAKSRGSGEKEPRGSENLEVKITVVD